MATDHRPEVDDLFDDAPADRQRGHLDARDLPPPKPLQITLERLAELDDDTVLLQSNDRRPQHLYPKLADRGDAYESVDVDGVADETTLRLPTRGRDGSVLQQVGTLARLEYALSIRNRWAFALTALIASLSVLVVALGWQGGVVRSDAGGL